MRTSSATRRRWGERSAPRSPPKAADAVAAERTGHAPGVAAAPGSYFGGESSARGDAASTRRSAARVAPSTGAADSGETDTGDRATRARRRGRGREKGSSARRRRRRRRARAKGGGVAGGGRRHGECYADGAIGHAAFYASDDDEDDKQNAKERKQNAKEAKEEARARREEETKSRERKLDVELGSLQRVMREKYGDKVDVAFEDKRGEKRAGGEEGGEGGEGGETRPPRGQKSQIVMAFFLSRE